MKSISEKSSLLGLSLAELTALVAGYGEPAWRAKQIYEWLYTKKTLGFEGMTNLSQTVRSKLAEDFDLGLVEPHHESRSSDGTKKYLFPVQAGKFVEAAYIPEPDRATLCLSTQVGCKMGCLFCATARQGLQGNLSAGQILNQYLSLPERATITNLVYMGMGEPLDNLEPVLQSLAVFTDPKGLALSPRRITLSTVGLLPALQRFIAESQVHLAISIHSPFDEERRSLMPVQHIYPITEVLAELRGHDWAGQRRLSFEYIMFQNLNDSADHALALAGLLKGLPCRVNLIHYHSVPGNDLQGSERATMERFQDILKARNFVTTIRRSRGEDIQAACGLLSTRAISRARVAEPDF